jgi:3-oxoadipate enol-lactonase
VSSGDPITLHVRCFGSGPPLLLIHGLGSSGDDWAFQIGALSEHYRVIVPDLRGCGRSPVGTGQVSIAGFAGDLWQLLDRLQLPGVRIAGFSMGGAVALEMALQRPGSTLQVVTINSLPSYRIDHWRKWLELNLQVAMVKLLGLPRTATMVGRRLFPDAHQLPMRQRVVEVLSATAVEPYLRCARALAAWCAAERIDALRTDLLMIAGEKDYTGLAEKQEWARRMGARLVVVAGSRHGTPFDAIQATNACLLAFFAREAMPEELTIDPADEVPAGPPELPPETAIPRFA